MANWYIGIKKGQKYTEAVEGASTTAALHVELRFTTATVGGVQLTVEDVEEMVKQIRSLLHKPNWPRASS